MKRVFRTRAVWAVTFLLVACLATSGCNIVTFPGGVKMDGDAVQPVNQADDNGNVTGPSGEPIYFAYSTCPSSHPSDWPPCTQTAGKTGLYAAAAYVCALGQIGIPPLGYYLYKDQAWPSMRTCMDTAILESKMRLTTASYNFYIVDFYQHRSLDDATANYVFTLAGLYGEAFKLFGIVGGAYTCFALVAQLNLSDKLVAGLYGNACAWGYALAVAYFQGG